ncbi:pre-mRNA-splicing factor 38-like isoform X1 [Salvia miltiorrhiza]|uniref:pre-mRNA-splicing factor 38-like isoform X1 n=1 Tax=Salvia miltiorrhiza TaxID=226208 RepID=UPI0025ACB616|nr:pre-mRNA-splicing factor 38-like isoform X1 [Salvia miltiorrhiza]
MLVDKAMELDHLGGTHGGTRKPTPFMCLVMKMLQIQPDKEIVVEFIKNPEYKYVRVLGAFYLRLTGMDVDVYRYLEPLYNDYRKLRLKLNDGKFTLTHVDEYIDELLTKDYSCDIALPRIKKRWTLEGIGSLEPRRSALEDDFEEEEEKEEDDQLADGLDSTVNDKDYYRARSPTREKDRDRKRDSHRNRFLCTGSVQLRSMMDRTIVLCKTNSKSIQCNFFPLLFLLHSISSCIAAVLVKFGGCDSAKNLLVCIFLLSN